MARNIDSNLSFWNNILDKKGYKWNFQTVISDGDHVTVKMSRTKLSNDEVTSWTETVTDDATAIEFMEPSESLCMKGTLTWKKTHGVNIIRFAGDVYQKNNFNIHFSGNGVVVAVWVND